jgi:hypothetical protein
MEIRIHMSVYMHICIYHDIHIYIYIYMKINFEFSSSAGTSLCMNEISTKLWDERLYTYA